MKKFIKIGILFSILFLLIFGSAYAQSEEIKLSLSRDFGYSSGTGKIQGLFSIKVASSVELNNVVFYIDAESIGVDGTLTYKLQFNTDNYSPGIHVLYAVGNTPDGKELKTREIKTEFVTTQESKKATLTILVPILGLSLLVVLFSAVIPALTAKKKGMVAPGSERNYGPAGGAICSRCSRPFARHILAPNMLMGKLERCPHCGKWGVYRAYPMDALRKAEEMELSKEKNSATTDDVDKLQNDLDNTKYQGL